MQSKKAELTKKEFLIDEGSLSNINILCWEKKEQEFSIHIFSSVYQSADELTSNYEDVRDYIAVYFQSQALKLDIERWNIYEFLFVKEKLTDELKQKIEQDKFSTRKIVVEFLNGEIEEERIKTCIIDELFTFEIVKRQIEQEGIIDCLSKDHKDVVDLIGSNAGHSNEDILTSLLNKFGHAKN